MLPDPTRGPVRDEATKAGDFDHRRAMPNAEYSRILIDCRDLISHRLLVSLTSMMDRLGDGLLNQANRSSVLSESTLLLESRSVLQTHRAYIVDAFEKALRARIDRRLQGESEPQAVRKEEHELELVEDAQVEEEIAIKNFMQSLSNRCHDQLLPLNARIGFLLGDRQLATEDNPFGTYALGAAFRESWHSVDIRREGKVIILKMMDAGMMGDVNAIYADINRHLANLNVLPHIHGGKSASRMGVSDSSSTIPSVAQAAPGRPEAAGGTASTESRVDSQVQSAADGANGADGLDGPAPGGDLFAMLRELITRGQRSSRAPASTQPNVHSGFPGINDAQLAAFLPLIMRAAGRPMVQGGERQMVPGGAGEVVYVGGGGHIVTDGAEAPTGGFMLQLPDGGYEPWADDSARMPIATGPGGVHGVAAQRAGGGGDIGGAIGFGESMAEANSGGMPAPLNPHAIITSLTRLQQSYGGGVSSTGAGVATGSPPPAMVSFDPYLLRRLGPAELGAPVDSTGAVTIELVAMLFDFVSSEKQMPDPIKSLLYRLQIPVLKAALLDKDFFTRRTHPARLLVNRYAEAGIAWQVEQGADDPLFQVIQRGVERIQAEFTDRLELFNEVLADLEKFLAREDERAEKAVQKSADEIAERERLELADIVADAELDRRINSAQPPEFIVSFLRNQWRQVLVNAYLETGEEGAGWRAVLAEMDNLLWSVQPKRKNRDRKDLVTRLPDMLARLRTRLSDVEWEINAREKFMSELVESHARAVTATMEREAAAAKAAEPLRGAMAGNDDVTPVQTASQDQYHGLAESMGRGMWVEFTEDSGILVFAKLSWVSPLRGKYLFTHRNGTKAFSLTREELAQRFRNDTARPVETEPLLDRAFSDVLSRLSAQAGL